MTYFNLESSQASRLNFDQFVENYASNCVDEMPEDYLEETSAEQIAEDYFGEGYNTNDDAEAKARHMAIFIETVNEAKRRLA